MNLWRASVADRTLSRHYLTGVALHINNLRAQRLFRKITEKAILQRVIR